MDFEQFHDFVVMTNRELKSVKDHNHALQTDNTELINKVRELQAEVERLNAPGYILTTNASSSEASSFEYLYVEPVESINQIAKKIHQTAVEKGWWEEDGVRNFPELIALMHSELSEALEEYRDGRSVDNVWCSKGGKPEGVAVELIDVVIRVFDCLAAHGVDIEKILKMKMDYNKTRPYRHGGKKA